MEDNGLDEWRDFMMDSNRLFSGFAPQNCGSELMIGFFNSEEGCFASDGVEKSIENCGVESMNGLFFLSIFYLFMH